MKRLLAIMLTLVLCLSLCSCGGKEEAESTTETSVENTKIYNVGETITTEQVEFTILKFGFYNCLSNFGDESFLTPIEENDEDAELYYVDDNPFNVDDEHIMLQFEYEYKNIGKEKFNEIDTFSLEYSDGYVFDDVEGTGQAKDGSFCGLGDIEPLSDKVYARAEVKLPKEVMENESEPIIIKVNLPFKGETSIKLR